MARWVLEIPFLGRMFHRMALSEFCRSLSTLLAGGIPLVSSMEVAVNAISNRHLRIQLVPTIGRVREGKALAETLEATGAAPDILVDMVEVRSVSRPEFAVPALIAASQFVFSPAEVNNQPSASVLPRISASVCAT